MLPYSIAVALAAAFCAASTPAEISGHAEGGARKQFDAALAAYQAQRYDEARNILTALSKYHPQNFEVNELLGLVFVAEGRDGLANPYLGRAVRLKPDVIEARTALGANLLRLHRTREAEFEFNKAVVLAPQKYEANHNLGEFYIQTGLLRKAIVFLRRAQEINPTSAQNGYDLALACEKTGDLNGARRELQSLLGSGDSAELHNLLGEVEEKSKNYLAAATQYEQAARLDPNEQNILDWGSELLLHQTFEPALEVFKAGLLRFPRSICLRLGLGIALYGRESYDDSARAFLEAADMNPSDPLPLTFAAKAYEKLSPAIAEQVLTRFQAYLDKNPNSVRARYSYALCLSKLNEKDSSPDLPKRIESLLKQVIAVEPANTDAYSQLGVVYGNEGRYPEAVLMYEKAVELDPRSPSLHYRLMQALMRTGQTARAREESAAFERLRGSDKDATRQNAEVEQFVYTMRATGAGLPAAPAATRQ